MDLKGLVLLAVCAVAMESAGQQTGEAPRPGRSRSADAPIESHARKGGVEIRFASSLDTQAASDVENWTAAVSNAKGKAAERRPPALKITRVSIGTDDRTVFLEMAGIAPGMQVTIRYRIKAADGAAMNGEIVKSIPALEE